MLLLVVGITHSEWAVSVYLGTKYRQGIVPHAVFGPRKYLHLLHKTSLPVSFHVATHIACSIKSVATQFAQPIA